jgi:hypothetical protein
MMQARRSVVVVVTVLALAAASGGPAAAKGRGLIRLMDQKGHVSTIKGDRAVRWWEYFSSSRCSSCRSPKQAAALLAETSSAGRRGARIFLFKPRYLGVSWPRAWILYASTRKTPAYVVVRGRGGAQGDSWTRVGRRVERIILGSSQGRSEDFLTAPDGTEGREATSDLGTKCACCSDGRTPCAETQTLNFERETGPPSSCSSRRRPQPRGRPREPPFRSAGRGRSPPALRVPAVSRRAP